MSDDSVADATPRPPPTSVVKGQWLAFEEIHCPNSTCVRNERVSPTLRAMRKRCPIGSVMWVDGITLSDGTVRSVLELNCTQWARIQFTVDGLKAPAAWASRMSMAAKQGFIVRGRYPAWPGDHCPSCNTWLRRPALIEKCNLHTVLPHICVTSVERDTWPGPVHIRLDSPTMPDFWLVLAVPDAFVPAIEE